jgi:hypothetical protein
MADLDFTLRFVTDGFLRGAPGQNIRHDQLRVPSLRGALRYWYRAKEYAATGTELFERESAVFGSTHVGQGVRIRPLGTAGRWQPLRRSRPFAEKYLGYGPVTDPSRRAIPNGTGFRFLASGSVHQLDELRKCLALLHLFGGIGSRCRRGWGSLAVSEESVVRPFRGGSLADWLENVLQQVWPPGAARPSARGRQPLYPAFSGSAKASYFGPRDKWSEVLQEFFDKFQLLKGPAKARPIPAAAPLRVGLGLPWKSGSPTSSWTGRRAGGGAVNRRSSPLHLSVLHENGSYYGVALFLDAQFFGTRTDLIETPPRGAERTVEFPGYGAVDLFMAAGAWDGVVRIP